MKNIKIKGTKKRTTKVRAIPKCITEVETEEGISYLFYIKVQWHRGISKEAMVPVPQSALLELEGDLSKGQSLDAKLVLKGTSIIRAQVGLRFGNNSNQKTFWQNGIREHSEPELAVTTERTGKLKIVPTSTECSLSQICWETEKEKVTILDQYREPLTISLEDLDALSKALAYINDRVQTIQTFTENYDKDKEG
ncbi:MAG: hypothetical protein U9M98_02545 [Patescibacteria group bacterium]|nr:hypothetical protein [Patescibacteria group bacterium]